MGIEVNIPPFLQPLIGGARQVEVEGDTVGACLAELARRYPRLKDKLFDKVGKLPKGMNIFVNGKSIYPGGVTAPVRDGDKIHITYVIQGG